MPTSLMTIPTTGVLITKPEALFLPAKQLQTHEETRASGIVF